MRFEPSRPAKRSSVPPSPSACCAASSTCAGVSTRRGAVAQDFDEMARLGFRVARWFLFCDGRAGIVYDDRSLPAGLDEQFFADVDAGLEIARDAHMRIDFVLFDHHWLFRGI